MDRPTDLGVADHQEIPGLHKPNRRGVMRRVQNPRQHVIGYRVGKKLRAHIAAFVDGAVDAAAFFIGETVVLPHPFHSAVSAGSNWREVRSSSNAMPSPMPLS